MKILGVLFLFLVASTSAVPFSSLLGAEEKTEQQGNLKAEYPSKDSESEAGEKEPTVEKVINNEDPEEYPKDKKDFNDGKDGELVLPLTKKDKNIPIGDEQNFRTGKHFFNRNVLNAARFKPHRSQDFYQPKFEPFYQYPITFGYPRYYPFGVSQQYSSFYQQQPYNGFLKYPKRHQQFYHPLAKYQKKPVVHPIHQKVQQPFNLFGNYRQQKPIFHQQNKNKQQQQPVMRPNFRLNNPSIDDSRAFDDEFYFPKDDYEREDTVVFSEAQQDDGYRTSEKEEDEFINSLTPQQIEKIIDSLLG